MAVAGALEQRVGQPELPPLESQGIHSPDNHVPAERRGRNRAAAEKCADREEMLLRHEGHLTVALTQPLGKRRAVSFESAPGNRHRPLDRLH